MTLSPHRTGWGVFLHFRRIYVTTEQLFKLVRHPGIGVWNSESKPGYTRNTNIPLTINDTGCPSPISFPHTNLDEVSTLPIQEIGNLPLVNGRKQTASIQARNRTSIESSLDERRLSRPSSITMWGSPSMW